MPQHNIVARTAEAGHEFHEFQITSNGGARKSFSCRASRHKWIRAMFVCSQCFILLSSTRRSLSLHARNQWAEDMAETIVSALKIGSCRDFQ